MTKDEKEIKRNYDKAQVFIDAATQAALILIEKRARAILRRKPHLREFVMAMGGYHFTNKKGEVVEHMAEHRNYNADVMYTYTPKAWVRSLQRIFDEWNDELKLTGEPMRFTAEGEVIRNW